MDTPPTTPPIPLSSPIGLVAGNGRFPLEFAENARAHGLAVVTIAIKGEADPRIEELSKECTWVRIGQLGKLLKTLRRSKVRQAALAGGVTVLILLMGSTWTGTPYVCSRA